MNKTVKILSGIIGGIVALVGVLWAVMEITANHGINHLFDREAKFQA